MLHHHRRFAVTVVPSIGELTEKLTEHTWTLCTCFEYQGLLLANDSFLEDGAQEYAVYKEARQVESLTMDREVMHLRDSLIPKYAELVYYGFWFAPEREALQALVDESQKHVTGTVRLKLYKGNIITCGRKSKYSLYDLKVASMEGVKSWYNQSDATGFIRLNGLRLRARNLAQGGPKV